MKSFWKDRSVFITGATGFLGRYLTQHLIERQARIVALVRDFVPHAPFFLDGLDKKVAVVGGGVEDYFVLERILSDYQVDTVFHLAAQAIVPIANRNPKEAFETNIRGTWNLLEACRRNDGVTRIVNASSDKAYGAHDELPYTEEHSLRGNHPYDVSKSCADMIAKTYHHTYGTPVSTTRCGNLFGPGDVNFSRLVPGTMRSALMGERPIIRSDGTPVRDYVYVEDIVDGYLRLAERIDDQSVRGRAFNFGTGEPLSVLELTEKIIAHSGRENLKPVILGEARAEIQNQYLSFDLASSALGWTPKAPVTERLRETMEWYRDYLERSAA